MLDITCITCIICILCIILYIVYIFLDIGYHKIERASLWVGINLLSIDENTVIVDNRQTELIKELKKHKIDALDCKIRHSRTLGGSFHCVTTETLRD